ncbi:MAG: MurR/RpiR family transcriptional regulator, partial [Clostridia bacterium]|nr:MurR/RpiR family transcriptional regulator [Clostridia bacterium]
MPALMKIKSAYSSLPSAERKVADFILNDPNRASLMVINEIAAASGVSVPSVTRLSKKLGYDGFMSFRVALATGLGSLSPLNVEPLHQNDSDEEAATKLMLLISRSIEDTAKVLDTNKLSSFCDDII